MLGSQTLEIAIGMSFVYLALASICSVIRERTEAIFRTRSIDLERGIRELLGEAADDNIDGKTPSDAKGLNTDSYTQQIYNHAMVNGLFKGTYNADKLTSKGLMPRRGNLPSYIPNSNFAIALLDVALKDALASGTSLAELQSTVSQIQNEQIRNMLRSAIVWAQGDMSQVRKTVEDWFDSAMDRVSGWYQKRTQKFIMVLSIVVTLAVNANTLTIIQRLSTDASLRKALVEAAAKTERLPASNRSSGEAARPGDRLLAPSTNPAGSRKEPVTGNPDAAGNVESGDDGSLKRDPNPWNKLSSLGFPLGWGKPWPGPSPDPFAEGAPDKDSSEFARLWYWYLQPLIGLLLTAFAISLGAPVWFDIMNRLLSLRASIKPEAAGSESKQSTSGPATAPFTIVANPVAPAFVPQIWSSGDAEAGII